jgi:hypothetical protein
MNCIIFETAAATLNCRFASAKCTESARRTTAAATAAANTATTQQSAALASYVYNGDYTKPAAKPAAGVAEQRPPRAHLVRPLGGGVESTEPAVDGAGDNDDRESEY